MRKLPEYLKEEDFNQTQLQKLLTSGELENDIDSFNTISFSTEKTSQDSKLEDYIMLIPTEKRKPIPPQVETYVPTTVTDYASDIAPNPDEDVQIVDDL